MKDFLFQPAGIINSVFVNSNTNLFPSYSTIYFGSPPLKFRGAFHVNVTDPSLFFVFFRSLTGGLSVK